MEISTCGRHKKDMTVDKYRYRSFRSQKQASPGTRCPPYYSCRGPRLCSSISGDKCQAMAVWSMEHGWNCIKIVEVQVICVGLTWLSWKYLWVEALDGCSTCSLPPMSKIRRAISIILRRPACPSYNFTSRMDCAASNLLSRILQARGES